MHSTAKRFCVMMCHDDHGTSHLHPPLLFKHSTPEHTVSQRVVRVTIGCRDVKRFNYDPRAVRPEGHNELSTLVMWHL